jgi:hypothetical protein
VGWLDVVGWAGSAVLVWSLLQSRLLRLRLLNLVGSVMLLGYNAVLGVWPMVGLNAVLAVINVVHLRGLLATRHDDSAYTVVEVPTDDEFLAHLMRTHATDIERFNPGFRWDPAAPGRSALIVVRGDEAAGVVLVRADGSVAHVELDYVTEKFRDFSPGEFVYRRSSWFTDRGFTTVVSPPRMVRPYYGKLGFRPTDASYVLDLSAR